MKLDRPLLFLDLETTHLDQMLARIVELGVSVLHPDGTIKPNGWSTRFNPGIPIPPEATETHHITDADVADRPPFSAYAQQIHEKIKGKDLAGFNLRRYDLPVLDEEMRRCGLKLDLTGVHVVDAFGLYCKTDRRDLSSYVERYAGRKHEGAHGAAPDVIGTMDGLVGQLAIHEDLREMPLAELAKHSLMGEQPADIAGKLYRDAVGDLRFGFGKNLGLRVLSDTNYCRWMLEKGSFPGSTLDAIREELERQ